MTEQVVCWVDFMDALFSARTECLTGVDTTCHKRFIYAYETIRMSIIWLTSV